MAGLRMAIVFWTSSAEFFAPHFRSRLFRCDSTVCGLILNSPAISFVVRPDDTSDKTILSLTVRRCITFFVLDENIILK